MTYNKAYFLFNVAGDKNLTLQNLYGKNKPETDDSIVEEALATIAIHPIGSPWVNISRLYVCIIKEIQRISTP